MRIEKAEPKDADLLIYFIKALAKAEGFPFDVTVTPDDILTNLLSTDAGAQALICYEGDQPCGFAVYYFTFSTTTGKRGLHLDDLFIEPAFQKKGYGKQVLVYLSQLAQEQDCARFEWWAVTTNVSAISFYKHLGAKQLTEFSIFRLEGNGISDLAEAS